MKSQFLFYKDRPEWADVVPVPQDEGDKSILCIAYSPEFVDASNYMRAVLLKDERSERALDVTSTVLQLNPANYTVWEYRRRILCSLESSLSDELQFVTCLMNEHCKNYQLWHHRQWLIIQLTEHSGDVAGEPVVDELAFIKKVLADDSKNYHAWQYRRWLVNHCKIPVASELAFTEALIDEDMYNNSAWNHRFVTVTKYEGLTPSVLSREIDFVQGMIRLAPNNDSSWNYLYGLLVPAPEVVAASNGAAVPKFTSTRPDLASFNTSHGVIDETAPGHNHPTKAQLVIQPPSSANLRMMRSFAENLAKSNPIAAESVALWGFLVEVYSDCIQAELSRKKQLGKHPNRVGTDHDVEPMSPLGDPLPDGNDSLSDLVELAVSTCERLSTELDRIRESYWRYRSRQIQSLEFCDTTSES